MEKKNRNPLTYLLTDWLTHSLTHLLKTAKLARLGVKFLQRNGAGLRKQSTRLPN